MRPQGWEKMPDEYLVKTTSTPFEWGVCDCLIFTSDWCKIACGVDPMSKKKKTDPKTFRGKYKTEAEARTLIKSYRKSIREIMDVHFERIHPNFAQRGDIVLHKMSFGISIGRGKAMFKTEELGMVTIDLGDCGVAWRI